MYVHSRQRNGTRSAFFCTNWTSKIAAEGSVRLNGSVAGEGSPRPANAGNTDCAGSVTSDWSGDEYYSDLQLDLLQSLDAIEASGTFASFGILRPIYPEVYLHDVGPISRSLHESQAQKLIEKAHQAPYGKGSETIVDTSVRNTWELNPDQFELRNPEWNDYVKGIVQVVGDELGVNAPFSAQLYKMLLDSKGAMFKPHTE